MSSVGNISLDLNVNSKKFSKQVDGIGKQTSKVFGLMSVAIGNIFADMAQKAVAGIGNFVKDSLDKGSEIAELQNVVDSVFTSMADKVEDFSKSALSNYGLTEAQSKKMMGTYGAMSKSFGYTEKQAYDMSAALTGLTADVASFYNLNHDEAYTKLKSVFTGETESLKELGVVMTQSALDQFALAKGFGKTTKDMDEQEKVALRLAFVQDKLAVASGDFLKTQDQWANQTRILTGQFDSLKAALGQGFINVLTPVIRVINTLMAKLVQLANLFKDFTARLMGASSKGGAGAAMAEVAEAADSAASSTGGIEKAAGGAAKAAKEAKKSLMGFDEINKLSSNDSSGSGGGGDSAGAMLDSLDLGDITSAGSEVESKTIPILDNLKKKISEVADVISNSPIFERLVSVYNEKLVPLFLSFVEGFKSIGSTIASVYNEYIQPILARLGELFVATWEQYIQPAILSMIDFIGKLANGLQVVWEMVLVPLINWIIETIIPIIAPIFERLGEMLIVFFGALSQIVGGIFEVLGGLIDFIVGVFTGDWELAWEGIKSIFKGIWDVIEGIVRIVWETITYIIEQTLNVIIAIITTALEAIKLAVKTVFTLIKNVITTIIGGIQAVISGGFNGAKNAVSTALDFIKTKVTNVFNAIWSFLKGIINTILGGIETLVNGVVNGFNSMIGALNGMHFSVPKWVPGIGGESFGFSIPYMSGVSLPRLAEGGYLKANQPTLAVVGDNKTQGEIVSPENKMFEIMLQALESFFSRFMSEIGSNQDRDYGDIVIPIYLDGTMLDEVIVTAQQRRALRSGGV